MTWNVSSRGRRRIEQAEARAHTVPTLALTKEQVKLSTHGGQLWWSDGCRVAALLTPKSISNYGLKQLTNYKLKKYTKRTCVLAKLGTRTT